MYCVPAVVRLLVVLPCVRSSPVVRWGIHLGVSWEVTWLNHVSSVSGDVGDLECQTNPIGLKPYPSEEEEVVVFTRENRGGSAQHATRAKPIRSSHGPRRKRRSMMILTTRHSSADAGDSTTCASLALLLAPLSRRQGAIAAGPGAVGGITSIRAISAAAYRHRPPEINNHYQGRAGLRQNVY